MQTPFEIHRGIFEFVNIFWKHEIFYSQTYFQSKIPEHFLNFRTKNARGTFFRSPEHFLILRKNFENMIFFEFVILFLKIPHISRICKPKIKM